MRQTPGIAVNAPRIIYLGKRPGAKLASHLSVGHGIVSEESKYTCFTYETSCLDVGRCMVCATTAKQAKSDADGEPHTALILSVTGALSVLGA